MEKYAVDFTQEAMDQLAELGQKFQGQIIRKVELLKAEPRTGRRLKGRWAEYWRLRSGDFRVVYVIADESREVLVTWIGYRRDAPYD